MSWSQEAVFEPDEHKSFVAEMAAADSYWR
jgi:hypothetical protein